MLRKLRAIVLLFVAVSVSAQTPDTRPVILTFGDSLTEGYGVPAELSYPAQLQKKLDEMGYGFRVVNQGISGNTTAMGLARFTRALALQPHVVVIQFGGNDRGFNVPQDITKENLRLMIHRFRAGGTRVFLAGRNLRTPEGGSMLDDLGKEENVPVISSFLDGVAGNNDLLLSDGSHPNAEGYTIVVNNVLKVLEPALKELQTSKR